MPMSATKLGEIAKELVAEELDVFVRKGAEYSGESNALSNFERARRCFEKAGRVADWQRIVEKVRSEHHRKTGFMPGFEAIIAGSGPTEKPSFLERAKTRWRAR